jgi:hypothetical protein
MTTIAPTIEVPYDHATAREAIKAPMAREQLKQTVRGATMTQLKELLTTVEAAPANRDVLIEEFTMVRRKEIEKRHAELVAAGREAARINLATLQEEVDRDYRDLYTALPALSPANVKAEAPSTMQSAIGNTVSFAGGLASRIPWVGGLVAEGLSLLGDDPAERGRTILDAMKHGALTVASSPALLGQMLGIDNAFLNKISGWGQWRLAHMEALGTLREQLKRHGLEKTLLLDSARFPFLDFRRNYLSSFVSPKGGLEEKWKEDWQKKVDTYIAYMTSKQPLLPTSVDLKDILQLTEKQAKDRAELTTKQHYEVAKAFGGAAKVSEVTFGAEATATRAGGKLRLTLPETDVQKTGTLIPGSNAEALKKALDADLSEVTTLTITPKPLLFTRSDTGEVTVNLQANATHDLAKIHEVAKALKKEENARISVIECKVSMRGAEPQVELQEKDGKLHLVCNRAAWHRMETLATLPLTIDADTGARWKWNAGTWII